MHDTWWSLLCLHCIIKYEVRLCLFLVISVGSSSFLLYLLNIMEMRFKMRSSVKALMTLAWTQEFWILILGSQEMSPLKLHVLCSQCNISSLLCFSDVLYLSLQVSLWLKTTTECGQQVYWVLECSKKIFPSAAYKSRLAS